MDAMEVLNVNSKAQRRQKGVGKRCLVVYLQLSILWNNRDISVLAVKCKRGKLGTLEKFKKKKKKDS
jgi:hypothetical protein